MKIKRAFLMVGIALLLFVGAAYHYLFGYFVIEHVGDSVTVLHRQNVFRQIGANVTIYKAEKETIVVDTQLSPLASSTRSARPSQVSSAASGVRTSVSPRCSAWSSGSACRPLRCS